MKKKKKKKSMYCTSLMCVLLPPSYTSQGLTTEKPEFKNTKLNYSTERLQKRKKKKIREAKLKERHVI